MLASIAAQSNVVAERVAVLSTATSRRIDGSQVNGQIREGTATARGRCSATGCPHSSRHRARKRDDMRQALGNRRSHLVVTMWGLVGDHDPETVVDAMGQMDFWSIAIRPGRPLAFGELRTRRSAVPIFGLPGNPVSALLTFEVFVRPALLKMAGRKKLHRPRVEARLLDRIDKPTGLRMFARGIHDTAAGTVRSTGPQGSGILRSMSLANCLIDLPEAASAVAPGDTVSILLTDSPEDH